MVVTRLEGTGVQETSHLMTLLAYRCENRRCHVIHYRASSSSAKCPSCKKEGTWTGKVSKKPL